MDLRKLDLQKLNSATKYPSIVTYHKMGNKGKLVDEVQVDFDSKVFLTEKIDGTNARIIWYNGDWILGSREDLLSARGDFLFNPSQGIVETLRPLVTGLELPSDFCWVIFGEVYGGKINKGAKQYTNGNQSLKGFRVFDIIIYPTNDIKSMMNWSREEIAAWRDYGGQPFLPVDDLYRLANDFSFETVPILETKYSLPKTLLQTSNWLTLVAGSKTRASLCDKAGEPEGIVVRSAGRGKIAKIRYEDYRRTLR